jgi:hypothetical protein
MSVQLPSKNLNQLSLFPYEHLKQPLSRLICMLDLLRLNEIHGIGNPGRILDLGIRGIKVSVEDVL